MCILLVLLCWLKWDNLSPAIDHLCQKDLKSGPHWKSSGLNNAVDSFLSSLSSIDFADTKKLFNLKVLVIPFHQKRLLDQQQKERKDILLARFDSIQHQIP